MDGHDLQPGTILAGRYRLEDLVGEGAGSRSWRAVDVMLNRSVGVEALSSSDPHSVAFLAAARQSTVVSDPRFLQVLDAVADEGGVTYVVREWTAAVPLAVLLREDALTSRRAASLCHEVADAMAHAHEIGVYHRYLNPVTILVKETDAVRISGLATEYALRSPEGGDSSGAPAGHAEQVDVTALGRVLYACLVARWPGGRAFDLAAAPTEHGRVLRPRQVRAGVSRDVDAVCDRILGHPPRHHGVPLRSARDIAAALAPVGEDEAPLGDQSPSLTGAATVAPSGRSFPPGATSVPAPPPSPAAVTGHARRHGAQARTLVAIGVALLVVMVVVMAAVLLFIGRDSSGGEPGDIATGTADPASAAPVRPLPLRVASDFDPEGDLSEHPEEAADAIDGDLATAWTTLQYTTDPQLGNLKNGVGLLIDFGDQKQATGVRVTFGDSPTNYEIWAAPRNTSDAPTQLTELQQVASRRASQRVSSVQFADPVATRYLLVWLTSLPEESPGYYRGVIRDIRVEGTA